MHLHRTTGEDYCTHVYCAQIQAISTWGWGCKAPYHERFTSNDQFKRPPVQDFFPAENSYDLVWIQWVVGHFTDVDFVKLVNRCRSALRKGGLVVIKDNVVGEGEGAFKVDSVDSSMTRSLGYFRSLFNHGGIKVVHQKQQEGFPGEIFPVYMFALE